MKILFALANPGAFGFYDSVARELCRQGHTVKVWYGPTKKAIVTDHLLKRCQDETQNCASAELHRPALGQLLFDIRGLIDCGVYFNPKHPSPWLEKRWEKSLSRPLKKALKHTLFRKMVFGPRMQQVLSQADRLIPPDRMITRDLKRCRPDVIVASPYIYGRSLEKEYVRAAHHLGIPTIAVVQSWDNLTTKGTYNIQPDVLLVWNAPLLEEAVEIHAVPRGKIVITGAPRFDTWFATEPSRSRGEFYAQVGLDPELSFVTYLCSSYSIAGDETAFVVELAQALLDDPKTKELKILVRPYPSNAAVWENIVAENLIVWPPGGALPHTEQARYDFYDTLWYSIAVAGVNTTAFLEAAIVDRPCLTVVTPRYQRTQIESAHFQHLRDADFIEIAESFNEFAILLANILSGKDTKADNRRRFVREFIRPSGVDQPAAPIMAEAILSVARGSFPD